MLVVNCYGRQNRIYHNHAFHAKASSDFFHFAILAALRENIAMYKTVADPLILFTEVIARILIALYTMAAPELKHISSADYLALERASKEKHELFQGKITAMAGASLAHNEIVSNLIIKTGNFLRGKGCRIYTSDLRVYIPTSESFTYPDATIICGKPEMVDDKQDTVKNPTVIIEVMSPSTEQNDRGAKFFNYMQIPSLKEYLLISSTTVFAQSARKQADNSWKFDELKSLSDILAFTSVDHEISLKEIYENVVFG